MWRERYFLQLAVESAVNVAFFGGFGLFWNVIVVRNGSFLFFGQPFSLKRAFLPCFLPIVVWIDLRPLKLPVGNSRATCGMSMSSSVPYLPEPFLSVPTDRVLMLPPCCAMRKPICLLLSR